jgi:hypothetical protein
MWTDGLTNMTKVIFAFRNIANAPKNDVEAHKYIRLTVTQIHKRPTLTQKYTTHINSEMRKT